MTAHAAEHLVEALRRRHEKDVFVAECKNGPTQTGSHRRLDAWVLLKTWSPVTCLGYEVKVDRGDWLRDDKIAEYMGLCHLFSLVAPKGLVKPEELPEGAGLLELVGTRLVTRRRAARREIPLPSSLLLYVLMCRARISYGDRDEDRPNWRVQELRAWAEGKRDRQGLSYALSTRIRERFDDQERRLQDVAAENRKLASVRARIAEMGFDPDSPTSEWQVRQRLDKLAGVVKDRDVADLTRTIEALVRTRDRLAAFAAGGEAE